MSKIKAGRPKMSDLEFSGKCAEAVRLRMQKKPKLTVLQIARRMGYKSRQAIAGFLNHDQTKCRCCQQPLVK